MALKPLNSVGGFSVGETPNTVIASNTYITSNGGLFSGNLAISNATASWGLLTDNLYYANGTPWDLSDPGGSNTQVQFNDDESFGGSAAFTFNKSSNLVSMGGALSVTGNANIGNIGTAQVLATANITAPQLISNVANGTAPFLVNSQTVVANLNADFLDGYSTATANTANTVAVRNADGNLSANYFTGNGAFLTGIDTSLISNGNSNVSVNANSNVTVSVAGNANVAVFTGTGANISGTVTATGNVSGANLTTGGVVAATGNVSGGNLTTAGVVAATGNVSGANLTTGGVVAATGNVSGGNLTTGGAVVATGNVSGGNITTGGVVAATGNVSGANLTTGGVLSVTGNANVGNIGATIGVFTGNVSALNANLGNLATANFVNVSSNVNVTNTLEAGNVRTDNLLYANGTAWDFQLPAGANTQVQFNDGSGSFGASANFTFDTATQILKVTGVANVTQHIHTPNIQAASNLDLSANGFTTVFDNTGNVSFSANAVVTAKTFIGNTSGNVNIAAANTTLLFSDDGNVNGTTGLTFNKTSNLVGLTGNLDLGLAAKNKIVNISNTSVEIRGGYGEADLSKAALLAGNEAGNLDWGRIRIEGNVAGNSAAILEANVHFFRSPGGVSNIVSVNSLAVNSTTTSTGALVVAGGIGATGNVNIGGALAVTGNIANANNISATNTVFANAANITANLTSGNANLGNLAIANFVQASEILNGNSNVRIVQNGNVTVSAIGNANVLIVTGTGANIVGTVQANGNGSFGALLSPTLTSNSGALTLAPAAGNENIVLAPTGTGNVDVSTRHITSVADPSNPQDAATKAYVDSVATGLQIHTAVRVTSATNLNATYANGGSSLTTIAITGGKTIQFSAAHGLSVDDEIYWANTFNGITAQNGYFVESTPASDTITVRATYTGAEVTTLTNGSGLTQGATANPGVGATLTNAGANAALSIDGITLSATNRVLVQGQTTGAQNGVYTVTTVGNGSTAWVLTRATDADQYAPTDVSKLGYGDYFFVSEGGSYAGSSYVLTTPTGEIVFGITSIAFTQFSAAGSYTAGSGINIVGTTISANTDGVTTAIVSGNIVVKDSAQLTTPNIGAATGTSLSVSGNVLANNLNANTLITAPNAELTANLLANNINANANITANNFTVNLALGGNTANFSGNVLVNNLTVNLELAGNTANFSGNVDVNFLKAGNGNSIPNLTQPIISAVSTSNSFIQAYIYNESNGGAASADFIAYPDNGDDISGWIDMGITSSGFNSADFSVTEENEGYLFMSAPDLSGTSGNLVFATGNTGANNSIEFFVDGFDQAKANRSMLIDTTGVTIKGNLSVGNITGILANGNSSISIPSANGNINVSVAGNANVGVFTGTGLVVTGNTRTTGVSGTGIGAVEAGVTNTILPNTVASFSANSNSYVQLTLQNKSALSDATSDFIATADNGSDSVNYVDVGIIGSGYDNNTPTNSLGNIVFPADSYMYAQGNSSNASQSGGNLAIGTTVPGKNIKIFAGGTNNQAIIANISNTGVAITGTLSTTGNVTVPNVTVNLQLSGNTANFSGNIVGQANLNLSSDLFANNLQSNNNVTIGNTAVRWSTLTTTAITANQTIATLPTSGITGYEFLVKGTDSTGSKYTVAVVTAVTDGTNVDYSTFGGVTLGSTTGTLAVNIVGGNIALQVTPASTNSTVWTTQYRTI